MPEIVVIWEYKSKQVRCGPCHICQMKRQKKKRMANYDKCWKTEKSSVNVGSLGAVNRPTLN